MLLPPKVVRTRFAVGCALHQPIKRMPMLAWTVTLPPMRLVQVNFVVEAVVNLQWVWIELVVRTMTELVHCIFVK